MCPQVEGTQQSEGTEATDPNETNKQREQNEGNDRKINLRFVFPAKDGTSLKATFSRELEVLAIKEIILKDYWKEEELGSKTKVRRLRLFHGGKELADDTSLEANGVSASEEFATAVHVIAVEGDTTRSGNKDRAKSNSGCCIS